MDENEHVAPSPKEGPGVRPSKKALQWFYGIQTVLLVTTFLALLRAGTYGWTLFLIIPFSIGLTAGVYTQTYRSQRLMRGSLIVMLILAVLSAVMIVAGLEGAICILMAEGLLALPALLGMVAGYYIRNIFRAYSLAALVLLNTSFYVYDRVDDSQVVSTATSSVVIHASREKVWHVLVHPVTYTRHQNIFFRAGISYPTGMALQEIDSRCMLMCSLNNGFVALPISAIDTLHRLRFTIPAETTHMRELTPYASIDARHLEGYFRPGYGEFVLDAIDENTCKLTANTSYRYKITPVFYWAWWCDYLVNSMHGHVLDDIRRLAETP